MTEEIIVAGIERIPAGEGRTFEVGDRSIAVFHTRAGKVFATQSHCPHKAGPLADGLVGNDSLVCPLHDRIFNLADGKGINNDLCIEAYPARLTDDGDVVVRLAQPMASER